MGGKDKSIDEIVEQVIARMSEEYYITEEGMFADAETVEDTMEVLLAVFDRCFDLDISRKSYIAEVIGAACIHVGFKSGEAVAKAFNIEDDDLVSDTIAEVTLENNPF